MATSLEVASAIRDQRLIDRVNFFVLKAAVAVMSEDNTTASHAERVTFANKVFILDYNLPQYVSAVLTNSTNLTNLDLTQDNHGISDSDMEFTVNSMYNAFAGVAT